MFAEAVDLPVPVTARPYQDQKPYCCRYKREFLFQCPSHGYVRGQMPCMKLDCLTCAPLVRARRGKKLYERFGGKPLGCAEFTLPGHWHERLGEDAVALLRRRAVNALAAWAYSWWGVALGTITHFHPEGDSERGHWKPHFHLAWPLLGVTPDVGGLVELPRQVPCKALDDLRYEWGRVLKEVAELLGEEPPPVNVHYSYRDTTHEKLHRLQYDARPFPAWRSGGLSTAASTSATYGPAAPNPPKHIVIDGEIVGFLPRFAVDDWREAVAGELPKQDKICPHEGCEHPLTLLRAMKPGTNAWNASRGAPLYEAMVHGEGEADRGPPMPAHPDGARPPPLFDRPGSSTNEDDIPY